MVQASTLLGCGDVGPIHGPIEHYGSLVRDSLMAADIRFAQVERVYSTRGELQPHSGGGHSRLPPRRIPLAAITAAGATAEIVRSNRAGGPERVLDVVCARAPKGFVTLNDVASREELTAIVGGYSMISSRGSHSARPHNRTNSGNQTCHPRA